MLALAESTEFPMVESLRLNTNSSETASAHPSSNTTASGHNDTAMAGSNSQLGQLLLEDPSEEQSALVIVYTQFMFSIHSLTYELFNGPAPRFASRTILHSTRNENPPSKLHLQ